MFGIKTKVKIVKKYYTIIDFDEVDIRIYLPEKVIIHRGRQAEVNITLRVDKSLCLPKLKSINVLLYDFSTKNENFLLSLLLLKTSKDFLTSYSSFY